MSLDPLFQANRTLTEAITRYLRTANDLTTAAERASAASLGVDMNERRAAFRDLSERGSEARVARQHLTNTVRRLRERLPGPQIEALAVKLDGRESADSALTLVRTILSETVWQPA